MKIYSLITARSGSKGLKDKNIYPVNKIPLIVYTIKASLSSKYIEKTFVSTDSKKYANLCTSYGANVPFIRPKEISKDQSTDFEVFEHFVKKMKLMHDCPDLIIHLRPTSPHRPDGIIDKCITNFLKSYNNFDSARSITQVDNRFLKSCLINEDNLITPIFNLNKNNPLKIWQQQRQNLPNIFKTDGRVDIIKKSTIEKNSLHGKKCYGFDTKLPLIDIDSKIDIAKFKKILEMKID